MIGVALTTTMVWHGWPRDVHNAPSSVPITVIAGQEQPPRPAKTQTVTAPMIAPTPLVAETPVPPHTPKDRAESIVTDFVARSAAPLAIEAASCSMSRCRVAVYQTADYVQRGRKFYETDDFTALTRAAGARSVEVVPYDRPERSGYLIDMLF